MWHSIQEYCKKINRELTFIDIASVFVTLITLVLLSVIIKGNIESSPSQVVYKRGENNGALTTTGGDVTNQSEKPFASKNGKTYTFSWCQGNTRINAKNKIYFSSEDEAKRSGRYLSKLCQK
jgi:hypothetical protein